MTTNRTYNPPLRSSRPPGPDGNFSADDVDSIMSGLSSVSNAATRSFFFANSVARLAAPAGSVQVGDVGVDVDTGNPWLLLSLPASTSGNWKALGGGGSAPVPNYLSTGTGWSGMTPGGGGHTVGLAATFTPNKSGVLLLNLSFQLTGTEAQSYEVGYAIGTGTAPTFDQAAPWTGVVSSGSLWFDSWIAGQETSGSFSTIVDSLALSTTHWIDLYVAFGGSGTCDGGVSLACFEL